MAKIKGHLLSDLIGYDKNKDWISNSYNFLRSLLFNKAGVKRYLDMHLMSRDVFRIESDKGITNLISSKDYDLETYLITNVELNPAKRNGHLYKRYSWGDRIRFLLDLFKKENYEGIEFMKVVNKLEDILIKSHISPEEYSPIRKSVNKYGYPVPYVPKYSFVLNRH